jgi:DNA mismatch repair protein MSH3
MDSRSQATISAYFTPKSSPAKKRSNSPFELTDDDDEHISMLKKRRVSERTQSPHFRVQDAAGPSAGPSSTPSRTASAFERWRADSSPSKESPPMPVKTQDETARKKRHDAFKRQLLKENSVIIRPRKSGSVEVIRERSPDAMDVEQNSQGNVVEVTDESGNESDGVFKNLREMFSNEGGKKKAPKKGKKAPTVTNAKTRELNEVTPSGQPYTPLEKQVIDSLTIMYYHQLNYPKHRCSN